VADSCSRTNGAIAYHHLLRATAATIRHEMVD